MVDQEEFKLTIDACWTKHVIGSALTKVWQKLSKVRQGLKHLKNTKYNSVEAKVQEIKGQLLNVQKQRVNGQYQELNNIERDLKMQFEKWASIEESIAQQKSRVQWL